MKGFYQFNTIHFPDRQQKLNTHLARFRLLFMPTTKFTVGAFIQYNSAFDQASANLRFYYHPSQYSDFYLVFNRRWNTNSSAKDENMPLDPAMAIILKCSHTFTF